MATSGSPGYFPPPRKWLDWQRWHWIDLSIPASITKNNTIYREGERYHLYCLHWKYFQDLIHTLAARCRSITGHGTIIRAHSVWIDGRPQVRWANKSGGIATLTNVELADSLVDMRIVSSGRTIRKAVLLQGKWTDSCVDLGPSNCNPSGSDPTNRERNLLEDHTGPIELFASSPKSPQAKQILRNGRAGSFDLSKDLISTGQLIEYGRYLLFPKDYSPVHEPYQALFPFGRHQSIGLHEDYEDLLLSMAIPPGYSPHSSRTVSPVQPPLIPTLHGRGEWAALVDSIKNWAVSKPRRKRMRKAAGQDMRYRSPARAITFAVDKPSCPAFIHDEENWSETGLEAVYDHDWYPPAPRLTEDPNYGFWYISIEVVYPRQGRRAGN